MSGQRNHVVSWTDPVFRRVRVPSLSASRTCSSQDFIMSQDHRGSPKSGANIPLPLTPRDGFLFFTSIHFIHSLCLWRRHFWTCSRVFSDRFVLASLMFVSHEEYVNLFLSVQDPSIVVTRVITTIREGLVNARSKPGK